MEICGCSIPHRLEITWSSRGNWEVKKTKGFVVILLYVQLHLNISSLCFKLLLNLAISFPCPQLYLL